MNDREQREARGASAIDTIDSEIEHDDQPSSPESAPSAPSALPSLLPVPVTSRAPASPPVSPVSIPMRASAPPAAAGGKRDQSDDRAAFVSLGRAIAVVIAISLGTLGAALPALILVWFIFALLATGVAAEALEQTGGLAPTTFGGGYWIAIAVNASTLLACIIRRVLGKTNPWHPLGWLTIAYGLLIWLLVPLDWSAAWDAPDVVTTFALLGADQLVCYLLPLVLVSLLLSSIKHAWLTSMASEQAAGRVIALGACLGLVGFSVSISLYAAGARGYFAELVPSSDELQSLDTNGVESDRQGFAELAASIGPPAPARYQGVDSGFQRCAEELSASSRPNQQSIFQNAVQRLQRQGMPKADAEDIAMDTLVRVCLKDREIDELAPYYWRAVCNNSKKLYRASRTCSIDESSQCACDTDSVRDKAQREQYLATLRQALDQVKPAERHLLESRYLLELEYHELAGRLEISEAGVRQRIKRARDHLRQRFEHLLALDE